VFKARIVNSRDCQRNYAAGAIPPRRSVSSASEIVKREAPQSAHLSLKDLPIAILLFGVVGMTWPTPSPRDDAFDDWLYSALRNVKAQEPVVARGSGHFPVLMRRAIHWLWLMPFYLNLIQPENCYPPLHGYLTGTASHNSRSGEAFVHYVDKAAVETLS
jgi:hypothetical protein